jgi:hypothetical protein
VTCSQGTWQTTTVGHIDTRLGPWSAMVAWSPIVSTQRCGRCWFLGLQQGLLNGRLHNQAHHQRCANKHIGPKRGPVTHIPKRKGPGITTASAQPAQRHTPLISPLTAAHGCFLLYSTPGPSAGAVHTNSLHVLHVSRQPAAALCCTTTTSKLTPSANGAMNKATAAVSGHNGLPDSVRCQHALCCCCSCTALCLPALPQLPTLLNPLPRLQT